MTILNLTDAAARIGISRPTLYKYLERPEYKPKMVAGHPTLTLAQIRAIKREHGKKK